MEPSRVLAAASSAPTSGPGRSRPPGCRLRTQRLISLHSRVSAWSQTGVLRTRATSLNPPLSSPSSSAELVLLLLPSVLLPAPGAEALPPHQPFCLSAQAPQALSARCPEPINTRDPLGHEPPSLQYIIWGYASGSVSTQFQPAADLPTSLLALPPPMGPVVGSPLGLCLQLVPVELPSSLSSLT